MAPVGGEGRREMEGSNEKRSGRTSSLRWWVLAAGAVLSLLIGVYLGLCTRAERHEIPFRTYAVIPGGGAPVELGGMEREEAERVLAEAAEAVSARSITVTCGEARVEVPPGTFELNGEETLDRLETAWEERPFLLRGFDLLRQLGRKREDHVLTWDFRSGGEDTADHLLEQLAAEVDREAGEPVCAVEGDRVTVTPGTPGRKLDKERAKGVLLETFLRGRSGVELAPLILKPRAMTAEEVGEQVYRKAEAVPMDDKGNILEPVWGRSIDTATAQKLLDGAGPGETVEIPLVFTRPDYAAAEAAGLLYRDLLSECVTQIGGSEGRLTNVTLAAKKCDGAVLLPGDTFDYNRVVGQRTAEAGYRSAPAYVQGQTVQEVGGGICQVSSSLYYCAVYADLEIVNRVNHRYAVSYLPEGLDATVSWGGPEFRFRNDSLYPVRISARAEGRELRVRFYGTDPKGISVKTERNVLSTTPYAVIYEADESVPAGTTREKVSPYTGKQVEVWRCVYGADGTLLSRTRENVSSYSHRDQVVLRNPADVPPTS